ncbi:MAG TPA: glycosyl hydrolase [Bacteroidetes bacterium]|nr:glycosyl hydrolase [Bacteroidota bacterium]
MTAGRYCRNKGAVCLLTLLIVLHSCSQTVSEPTQIVSPRKEKGAFTLFDSGKPAPLCISSKDWPGVIRAFRDLQADILRVCGNIPELTIDTVPQNGEIIVAGTIGKSPLIDRMIEAGKITTEDIAGKWECFLIQVVEHPFEGVDKALVVAGSDKRGTIYGIYEISEQIGVSPWYWWADVPVKKQTGLYIKPVRYTEGEPSVKYRGIFLNDEAPALTNWVAEKYGMVTPQEDPPIPPGVAAYNTEFYSRIFELLLRLKANYLWPAMWNNAFNEDDPENPRLADEYGIVMGTSHQEPMLRAQKEWDRRYLRTLGRWDYVAHPEVLEEFWRGGIRRNKDYESIITIGLRGADDTEMMPGGPEVNIPFLEKIIEKQRNIIAEEIHPDVTQVPQLWCLYKEVQEYYHLGMRVPDNVTLLWSDDNWGNLRRLPTAGERKRSGGAGIYYHFDYHGGPRSYQWINTNPIPKIWDQMNLAKQYEADRIWIVNAGHFKGYEFPVEFFLRMAWNTDHFRNDNIREYTEQWAARQFGNDYAREIARIIAEYTRFNGRRKPELLAPHTYSLLHYHEAERIVSEYNQLAESAEEIYHQLPFGYRDAFFQLVWFPVKACALVNELYVTAGKNNLYAKQKRSSTNLMAEKTRELFRADTALMGHFNRELAEGKWNHFMDQAHLGYTGWADPPVNSLRHIDLKTIDIPDPASMGVAIEGSELVWPGAREEAILPVFDIFNRQKYFIDIFNRGKTPYTFSASSDTPWITIRPTEGTVETDRRIWIEADWERIEHEHSSGLIRITGAGEEVQVKARAFKPAEISPEKLDGFVEARGYVSMEAEHYTNKTHKENSHWTRIEDYGHTLSAMRAAAPVDAPPFDPGVNAACLEYRMYLFTTGEIEVTGIFSPTLNFLPSRPLRYAVSFDQKSPRIITLVPADFDARNGNRDWENTVMDNARFSTTNHTIEEPGYHTLKIWMVDPGVVIQKIVVNTGGLKPSYLGPPESFYRKVPDTKNQ